MTQKQARDSQSPAQPLSLAGGGDDKSELEAAGESIDTASSLLDIFSNPETDLNDDERRILLTTTLPLLRKARAYLRNSRGIRTGEVATCIQAVSTLISFLIRSADLTFPDYDGLKEVLFGLHRTLYAANMLLQTQAKAAEPEHAERAS